MFQWDCMAWLMQTGFLRQQSNLCSTGTYRNPIFILAPIWPRGVNVQYMFNTERQSHSHAENVLHCPKKHQSIDKNPMTTSFNCLETVERKTCLPAVASAGESLLCKCEAALWANNDITLQILTVSQCAGTPWQFCELLVHFGSHVSREEPFQPQLYLGYIRIH